jgi:hypothetical protein
MEIEGEDSGSVSPSSSLGPLVVLRAVESCEKQPCAPKRHLPSRKA